MASSQQIVRLPQNLCLWKIVSQVYSHWIPILGSGQKNLAVMNRMTHRGWRKRQEGGSHPVEVWSCRHPASGEWGRGQDIKPVCRHSLGQRQEPRQAEQLPARNCSFHILSDFWMLGPMLEKLWRAHIIVSKTDIASHLVGFMVKGDRGHWLCP